MRLVRTILLLVVALIGAAALAGACAHGDIPRDRLMGKYALPASRYVELEPGLEVHYIEQGRADAPAIVLVHGFAASVHAWLPWSERLGGDYRLIALDLPGHGLTDAPPGYRASLDGNVALVGKLADRLKLPRFALAGNSMGGAVAWRFAMMHPERLRGLVLVDAAGWPDPAGRGGPPPLVALFNNPLGRAIIKLFDPAWFASSGLRSAYIERSLVTKELIDRYAELARAPGHRDILLTMNSRPAEPVLPADFGRISNPTLVISGDEDRLIPADQSRAIAAAIPGSRLITYPGVGHVPMEQIPDQSAADLREFLSGLPR